MVTDPVQSKRPPINTIHVQLPGVHHAPVPAPLHRLPHCPQTIADVRCYALAVQEGTLLTLDHAPATDIAPRISTTAHLPDLIHVIGKHTRIVVQAKENARDLARGLAQALRRLLQTASIGSIKRINITSAAVGVANAKKGRKRRKRKR